MNDMAKNLLLWVVIALVLMMVFNNFGPRKSSPQSVEYSKFITDVQQGQVQKVVIEGRTITGTKRQGGEQFVTYNPGDPGLMRDLFNNNVEIISHPPEQQSLLMQIFIPRFPTLYHFSLPLYFICQS